MDTPKLNKIIQNSHINYLFWSNIVFCFDFYSDLAKLKVTNAWKYKDVKASSRGDVLYQQSRSKMHELSGEERTARGFGWGYLGEKG